MARTEYDRHQAQTEVEIFCEELAGTMGEGWKAVPYGKEPAYWGAQAYITDGDLTISVVHNYSDRNLRERWLFGVEFESDHYCHIVSRPSITVSHTKKPEQIADELKRRFIEPAREALLEARTNKRRYDSYRDNRKTTLARLLEAGRGHLYDTTITNTSDPTPKASVRTTARGGTLDGIYLDFEAGDNSVMIRTICSIPVALAEAFARCIADYAERRNSPSPLEALEALVEAHDEEPPMLTDVEWERAREAVKQARKS